MANIGSENMKCPPFNKMKKSSPSTAPRIDENKLENAESCDKKMKWCNADRVLAWIKELIETLYQFNFNAYK